MSGGGASARPPQRVCFFGTYARDYTVMQLLQQSCRSAGIEVVECHRPLWEETRHKDARYFGARSAIGLMGRYTRHAVALARARRDIGPVPLYLVGFNGQLDCLLLRLLMLARRTPIVFAPLVTLTETLVDDRGVFPRRSPRGALARLLDGASLSAATHVIIDTEAHRRYVIEEFGVAPERVTVWHLGADPMVFRPAPAPRREGPLRVLFYGTFLPLHGIRTILQAAALLKDEPRIEFALVGDGPDHAASMAYARDAQLGRVHFADWVQYANLGETVAQADICLGSFGTTPKAQMVIPNKVYQCAAVGRPIITADTPATREVFEHKGTAFMCPPGDAPALAAAIQTLCDDAALRERLGRQAAAVMADRFAPAAQAGRLAAIFGYATHIP